MKPRIRREAYQLHIGEKPFDIDELRAWWPHKEFLDAVSDLAPLTPDDHIQLLKLFRPGCRRDATWLLAVLLNQPTYATPLFKLINLLEQLNVIKAGEAKR